MNFADENWNQLLPSYLSASDKDRLKNALEQFKPEHRGKEITYNDFYKDFGYKYFLQADIVKDIRSADWIKESSIYEKIYSEAIIISNTCDISFENKREANQKQCLFAPLLELSVFLEQLKEQKYPADKLKSFEGNVKAQLFSNIFYLPSTPSDNKEYIALLDKLFWFPVDELTPLLETISDERISSLNQYGFYLFILKLSYHLNRLPESCDREVQGAA